MRLCFVAPDFPSNPDASPMGGLVRNIYDTARSMAERGNETVILTTPADNSPKQQFLAPGLVLERTWVPRRRRAENLLRLGLRSAVRTAWSDYRFELIEVPDFGGSGWTLPRSLPIVTRLHTTFGVLRRALGRPASWRDRIVETPERVQLRRFPVSAPTEFILNMTREAFNERLPAAQLVPMLVRDEAKRNERTPVEDFFLFVGRLERNKGLDLLLEAFNEYLTFGRVKRLIVVGWDPRGRRDPSVLDEWIPSPSLRQHVNWHGALARSELSSLYASAVAVVLPSRHENVCLTALEAALSHAQLVLPTRTGIRELLRDDEALWFENSDIQSLVESLRRAESQPIDRDRTRKSVFSRFASPNAWDLLATSYQQLAEQAA